MEVRKNINMWIRPALEVAWKRQNVIVRSEFWPSQFAKPDVPFCLAHVNNFCGKCPGWRQLSLNGEAQTTEMFTVHKAE